jgi:hypothetical protein
MVEGKPRVAFGEVGDGVMLQLRDECCVTFTTAASHQGCLAQ